MPDGLSNKPVETTSSQSVLTSEFIPIATTSSLPAPTSEFIPIATTSSAVLTPGLIIVEIPTLSESSTSTEELRHFIHADKPNQCGVPSPQEIVKKGKTVHVKFQEKWYRQFPWLHYELSLNGVLCFMCAKADRKGCLRHANKAEPVFLRTGFKCWKKALEKFGDHEKSTCHQLAVIHFTHQKGPSVLTQLSTENARQQEIARRCLMKQIM